MNKGNQPLLLSLAMTLLSLTAVVLSYGTLQSVEEAHKLVLFTIPNRPVTYVVRNYQGSSECAGSFDLSIDSGNNQTSITMRGWMLLSVFGRAEPVTVDASLVFNALGQLSASIFRTVSRYEAIRFGTMGVNPITAQIYKSPDGTPPIFEQTLPGPVELQTHDDGYQLVAPQLPSLSSPFPRPSIPVSLEEAPKESCSRETAHPIDLSPFLQTAASLSDNVRRLLPAP